MELDINTCKKYFKVNYPYINLYKNIIDTLDNNYIKHIPINEKCIDKNTCISIVMTTHNRVVQTYYTLETIAKSKYKDIHVVIVDDTKLSIGKSSKYQVDILDINKLSSFDIYIDYIEIINKNWVNACVNYNIGFKFIKGDRVIIQNSEVCHIDDVISNVDKNLKNESCYLVYDVFSLYNEVCNNAMYKIAKDLKYEHLDLIINLGKDVKCSGMWFNHYQKRNTLFHFLCAIRKQDLEDIEFFDLDYATTIGYDDNNLVLKLKNNSKINIKNIKNDVEYVFGVHQWHYPFSHNFVNTEIYNKMLYQYQTSFVEKNGYVYSLLTNDGLSIDEKVDKLFV